MLSPEAGLSIPAHLPQQLVLESAVNPLLQTGNFFYIPMCKYLLLCAATSLSLLCQTGDRPLKPRYEDGAAFRWINKPVLSSRLLDMESLQTWSFSGHGELTLSDTEVKDGTHSIRLHSVTDAATTGGEGEWIDLMATRKFPSEDWGAYNRISLWVYPDVEGAPAISCTLVLHNDGAHKLPDRYNEGRDESIPLNNHQWNHVVWEIAPLDRDKVTALDVAYSLPKKYPDPGDRTTLYLDQLELQKVDPDHVEGWDVAAGKIAFSSSGYTVGGPKSAIASDLPPGNFSVLSQDTGEQLLTKQIKSITTPLGVYQVLDFSEIRTPGAYVIRTNHGLTRPFAIGDDAWRNSILKALNFLYSERCGTVIPGIHGICHQDCYTSHGDKRIVVNGGYHDAGDLTATGHTPRMVYAMLSLAERLHEQGLDPALENRLIAEAKWGLAWVLKTRFGDGYRSTGQLISYWTDNIMGDDDDRHGEAVNDPEWNFRVASTEALAYRVLKERDAELANRSLAIAREDWGFAVQGLATAAPIPAVYGQKDELERDSIGALASVDLYEATGEQQYADEAVRLAALIVASQERKLQPWSIPLTGYFYSNPQHQKLFQRFHIGEEQAPIVALAHLCEALPNHIDWMKWYSAIVLHSKYYLEQASKVNAPYDVLPAAIYRESEARLIGGNKAWTPLRAADANAYVAEVRQGIALGGDYYLRRFPVWFDFRGNDSVLLSQAKALSTAARLRGDIDGIDLAEKQAQWIVGRNPFAASVMYGEGYDWTPLYSVRSGQMVGALPVGIETKGFADAPYWPNQICWTYKEVWTHPVGRWIWLMQDLAGPSVVSGIAAPSSQDPVQIREQTSGLAVTVIPDSFSGTFRTILSEGRYTFEQAAVKSQLSVLPGVVYHLDLRPGHAMAFESSVEKTNGSRDVPVSVKIQGSGRHTFALRTSNLAVADASKIVDLQSGRTAELIWNAHVQDRGTPWVAVVVPDGNLNAKQELSGTVKPN
ncbi:MAG: glycoside hydrolase family 9 protein [Bryobacteraceae bacterium]